MISFKKKSSSPVILYLHGYKSQPGDSVETALRECGDYEVRSVFLDHTSPKKTYREVLNASKGVSVIVGLSMGGFWASLLPEIPKVLINPAFLFPYILLHKTGSRGLFTEYMEVAKSQFPSPLGPGTLVWAKGDKTEPLGIFSTFWPEGKVIDTLHGHVPSSQEITSLVIPEIKKYL